MFPSALNQETQKKLHTNLDWLENSSFQVDLSQASQLSLHLHEDRTDYAKEELAINKNEEKETKSQNKKKHHSSKRVERRKKDRSTEEGSCDDDYDSNNVIDEEERRKKIVSLSKKVFFEETGLSHEQAFRIDNKSDRNNLAFNSVYNALVSSYDKSKRIKSRNILNQFKKCSKTTRYCQPGNIIKESKDDELIVPITSHQMDAFIPLHTPTLTQGSLDSSRISSVYDTSTQLYLQGKGLPQKSTFKSSQIQFNSMPTNVRQPSKPTLEQIIYSKTQEFNEYLKQYPCDVDKWLQFLKFQEENVIFENDKSGKKSLEIVIAEKKLSIVEKALEANPQCFRLIIKKLKIMEVIASSEEVEAEWDKLVFLYPNVPLIWHHYIIFLKTNVTHYTTSKLLKLFLKCLKTFSLMHEGLFRTHQSPDNLEEEMLKIIYQTCLVLEEAGYIEKSIAIFQALIEFNLFTPQKLNQAMPLEDWITLFEPFWDLGSPRFGEPNSYGWAKVLENKYLPSITQSVNIDDKEDEIVKSEHNKAAIWFKIEYLKEKYHWLPVKGYESEDIDDPERNITFDDISPFLIRFRKRASKFNLVIYFLKFLNAVPDFNQSPILFKGNDFPLFFIKHNPLPMPSYFNRESWFTFQDQIFIKSIETFENSFRKELIQHRILFLIKCVKNGVINLKHAQKLVKDILKHKENRNNIDLWSLYTDLEEMKDDKKDAKQIYEKAISMFTGNIDLKKLISFVRKYCQFMLEIRSLDQMTIEYEGSKMMQHDNQLLLTLVNVINQVNAVSVNSVMILKTLRMIDVMLEQVSDGHKTDIIYCKALIYLLNQDIKKIWSLFDKQLKEDANEPLYTSYLQFILINCNRSFGSLTLLRRVLKNALDAYPTNQEYLLLFINIESKMLISTTTQR